MNDGLLTVSPFKMLNMSRPLCGAVKLDIVGKLIFVRDVEGPSVRLNQYYASPAK